MLGVAVMRHPVPVALRRRPSWEGARFTFGWALIALAALLALGMTMTEEPFTVGARALLLFLLVPGVLLVWANRRAMHR